MSLKNNTTNKNSNHNKSQYLGWVMAFAAVALFSSKAIVVKLIYRFAYMDAINTISLRMLMALPIFAIVAYMTWAPLSKKQYAKVILAGFLGYYAASFLDFIALQFITSSLERLILFTNPGVVLILSCLFLHERINRWQLLSLIAGYISLSMVFLHETLGGSNVFFGASMAMLSVISYACYLILCASIVKEMGAIRLTSLASIVATIFCTAQLFILRDDVWGMIKVIDSHVYVLSAINAIFCTAIPVFLTMLAIERCGPSVTAQTGIVGPMVTILLGVWLLGEHLTIYHYIGTFGVICSMLLLSKGIKNKPRINE
jgi:drug/metabolite transporter (DMT)-like permease